MDAAASEISREQSARQVLADTVEKGKNEPIEFFARALVEIDSS
jgi:hypothetical protein